MAYWPLTFHVFSLKNDALNYFLPVRYQISDSISHGFWPFWSPYLNLGYPLHGDMQSGVWNPVVQIFSLFGPYTLKTLQNETLLYIYLSGVGMYFLAKYFTGNDSAALLAGTAFMLCGFNSDSAQFLNWISASSFMPFTLLFYYRTLKEKRWEFALTTSIFLWLLFTTAYPADFILTAYALLFVLLLHLWKKENRQNNARFKLLKLHCAIAVSFLALSLPAILSYAEFLPLSERGSGASYEEVMSNPLHPGLLFSWITPLPVWKVSFASITDPLERNSYYGLITFALVLLGFLTPTKSRFIRYCKWGFLLSLLFSFGEMGGIRIISYYVLPLMKTFRHPANAKLFTIFFGCLLAAFMFAEVQANPSGYKRQYRITGFLLLLFFVGLFAWSLTGKASLFNDNSLSTFNAASMKKLIDSLTFSELLLINLLLQVPFFLAIYLFLIKKFNTNWLLFSALANSVLMAMLVQPFTVVKKDSVNSIEGVLNSVQVKSFIKPDLKVSIASNSADGMKYYDEIGTANMYNKKIGRVDYRITPSNLLDQNTFWFNNRIRNTILSYPIFYRGDTIVGVSDTSRIISSPARYVIVDDPIKDQLKYPKSKGYSSFVVNFTPNEFQLMVNSTEPGLYCLFQNYYPRWHLKIDSSTVKLKRVNLSFMGFEVPAGAHKIILSYSDWDLKLAFWISIGSLVIILLFIQVLIKRKIDFNV